MIVLVSKTMQVVGLVLQSDTTFATSTSSSPIERGSSYRYPSCCGCMNFLWTVRITEHAIELLKEGIERLFLRW